MDDGSGVYSFYQIETNVVGERLGNNRIRYIDDVQGNGLAAGEYVYYVSQVEVESESAGSNLAFVTVQDLMMNFSLSFDGIDDYIEVPSTAIYDTVVHEISIEAWVNMPSLPSQNNTIIARRDYDGSEKHHFEFNITKMVDCTLEHQITKMTNSIRHSLRQIVFLFLQVIGITWQSPLIMDIFVLCRWPICPGT